MKVTQVIEKAMRGEIRWIEAADILGISDRQMRRWKERYQADGAEGLRDQREGKIPQNRVADSTLKKVLELYRGSYEGFNVTHFHEMLIENEGIHVGRSWVNQVLHDAGYVRRHPKRGRYRRRRERKPMMGMMVHLDGSTHAWWPTVDGSYQDLLVLLDDATGEIFNGLFVPQESTKTSLTVLRELVVKRGTFGALYTDRASHFVFTPTAGKEPDRTKKTQVERVLDDLGIELICAYSPQARGRSERLWRTLQGRLPQELARARIADYERANSYFTTKFIPRFNQRFAVKPAVQGSAFVPVRGTDLEHIFTLRFERTVNGDNTIRFQNRILQLPKVEGHSTLKNKVVSLRFSLEGVLRVFLGQRLVASFEPMLDLDDPMTDIAA